MAQLFDVDVRTVNEHLNNIFNSGELDETATIRKFWITQTEGARLHDKTPGGGSQAQFSHNSGSNGEMSHKKHLKLDSATIF